MKKNIKRKVYLTDSMREVLMESLERFEAHVESCWDRDVGVSSELIRIRDCRVRLGL
jgi:ribosome-associated translation inhibitor RaiA